MIQGTFPKKIDVLLKCLPESPYKEQLRAEIDALSKESYLQGSKDCHDAMMQNHKVRKMT